MTSTLRPLAEVTAHALRALTEELGVSDTARFLAQYGVGYGDYTAEREARFGALSVDEVLRLSRIHGAKGA